MASEPIQGSAGSASEPNLPGWSDTLAATATAAIAGAATLNQLDAVAGDGDLGVTVTAAANALLAIQPEVAALETQDPAAALRRCGSEVARKAPSTCGTLLATGLLRAARAASEPGYAAAPDVARLAVLLAAAQAGIQERGKSAPGDRTLLDALAPAVDALRAAEGAGLPEALRRAAAAAQAGAEETK